MLTCCTLGARRWRWRPARTPREAPPGRPMSSAGRMRPISVHLLILASCGLHFSPLHLLSCLSSMRVFSSTFRHQIRQTFTSRQQVEEEEEAKTSPQAINQDHLQRQTGKSFREFQCERQSSYQSSSLDVPTVTTTTCLFRP